MLHILIPYDPATAIDNAPCRTCGKSHPHEHEMIVVEAVPIGPPIALLQHLDPWAISTELPPPRFHR